MEQLINMATSTVHADIISTIKFDLMSQFKKEFLTKKVRVFSEQVALVYMGERWKNEPCELINAENTIYKEYMDDFGFVQPDIFFFKDNKLLENKRKTRIIGYPDLIIEVWSEGNLLKDKKFKERLYSTAPSTEHWYIEQESNIVNCYLGEEKLPRQSLKKILKTLKGIEIDLTPFSIKELQ